MNHCMHTLEWMSERLTESYKTRNKSLHDQLSCSVTVSIKLKVITVLLKFGMEIIILLALHRIFRG